MATERKVIEIDTTLLRAIRHDVSRRASSIAREHGVHSDQYAAIRNRLGQIDQTLRDGLTLGEVGL